MGWIGLRGSPLLVPAQVARFSAWLARGGSRLIVGFG